MKKAPQNDRLTSMANHTRQADTLLNQSLRRIHIMTNKVYDILKFIAQIMLPALGTLYLALSKIWGFPYGEEIVCALTAVDLFLGTVLHIDTVQYNKRLDK